ncbi:MAG: hypothetical protein L0Y72_24560 [Gemmataceae bacterium]|nr:hypothetical protein [Gemmataceae bacterium]MCI0742219.1 hypothetical protein [Gemmataceae bacterium]
MRVILLVSGGLVGVAIALIVLGVFWPGLGDGGPGLKVEDFGLYWSSARVGLEGGSPYDPIAVFPYQQAIEPGRSGPALPWGPPWSMGLLYPFAAAGFPAAR